MGTWKGAQHHISSLKYKSKPQWDITSQSLGGLFFLKENNKCWHQCGETGMYNREAAVKNSLVFLNNLNIGLPYELATLLLGI